MTWHILGGGSIGCLWAVQLYTSGLPVRLIVRNTEQLTTLSAKQGIDYQTMDQTHNLYPIEGELASDTSPIHRLIITTKAYATLAAFESIKQRIAPDAQILLLQNGMGQHQQLKFTYPHLSIWAASTTDGAYLASPFEVIRAGIGETLYGKMFETAPSSESLFTLPIGDLKIQQVINIEHRLWCKLAINAVINPLTAINDCKNGELFDNPTLVSLMEDLCGEIETIASNANQTLFDLPLIEVVEQVARQTASNFSSMLQDVRQARQTEIEQISGFLCHAAQSSQTPSPLNNALLSQIRILSQ